MAESATNRLTVAHLLVAAHAATGGSEQFYVRNQDGTFLNVNKIVLERDAGRTSKLDLVIEVE